MTKAELEAVVSSLKEEVAAADELMRKAAGELKERDARLELARATWRDQQARITELEGELVAIAEAAKVKWGREVAAELWASRTGEHPSPAVVKARVAKAKVHAQTA